MLGWEFPPYSSGGLGTACYGLIKGLSNRGVDVSLVLPVKYESKLDFVRIIPSGDLRLTTTKVNSSLFAYATPSSYKSAVGVFHNSDSIYGGDLFEEVYRYSKKVEEIAKNEDYDVIHCHDWMTFIAGINAKRISKKPLVVHVHATEFDRTAGLGVNQLVYDIERRGMHAADAIIAVSNFTKGKIIEHYGVHKDKILVVHNAVDFNDNHHYEGFEIKDSYKIVLFLGRITIQKGPDYFLYAARRVLEYEPNVLFVIAGSGDMEAQIIEKAAELGISDRVLFAGFLKGEDVDRAYKMADLYVMPSVSEPFGITPLEAMRNNTPVIISKQSGVSEVINHCLKVDFWDINEMSNMIISVLRYGELRECLGRNGFFEVKKFNWDEPAEKCISLYNNLLGVV